MTRLPLVVAAVLSIASNSSLETLHEDAVCQVAVVQGASPPKVVGPSEIASRAQVVTQPGSPVAILQVDLSESSLTVAESGVSKRGGPCRIEVQNVSDRVMSQVSVMVHTRLRNNGWGGSGTTLVRLLAPGQTVWLSGYAGVEAVVPVKDQAETQTIVSVESVHFDNCVSKPAQVMPLAWSPLPSSAPSHLWR